MAGCGFPRPIPLGGVDAGDDGGTGSSAVCAADQTLRCDGSTLVRCNAEGTAEIDESCALGCSATEPRCNDVAPSNGLGAYLDLAAGESDVDLGAKATINTDDGTVMVDGSPIVVKNALVAQTSAPTILVFLFHSLTAGDVKVFGRNAFALVSDGDVAVRGVFSASASGGDPGPGRYNDGSCEGGDASIVSVAGLAIGGGGGGGFGGPGGKGGSATNNGGTAPGGRGGAVTGNPELVPLRGGCDGGTLPGGSTSYGGGGGAIQLVSRSKIAITGVVAANGSSSHAGGSGGGILLEAPIVEISGSVVANGAGGGGGACGIPLGGENGRLDGTVAAGGPASDTCYGGAGGSGGAGDIPAHAGADFTKLQSGFDPNVYAGYGGGGVGRVRINTAPDGFRRAGLFSPNPSTGSIGIR